MIDQRTRQLLDTLQGGHRAQYSSRKEAKQQARSVGITTPSDLVQLVAFLNSPSPLCADLAYCKLVRKAKAISYVLDNADPDDPANPEKLAAYGGTAPLSPLDSVAAVLGSSAGRACVDFSLAPSRAAVSLYLVEALILKHRGDRRLSPHVLPRLTHASITDQLVDRWIDLATELSDLKLQQRAAARSPAKRR